jgi:hypothetical protein
MLVSYNATAARRVASIIFTPRGSRARGAAAKEIEQEQTEKTEKEKFCHK